MSKTPKVEPIQVKEFTVKQSKYDVCGKLPIRSVILGPSGSGKTVLLQNMILDIYRDCFSRIFIFSPSIEVDDVETNQRLYREAHEGATHRGRANLFRPLRPGSTSQHFRNPTQDNKFSQEEGRYQVVPNPNHC